MQVLLVCTSVSRRNKGEMSATGSTFFAIVFVCFVAQGLGKCTLDSFTIGSVKTGLAVQGKPEWEVTVINNCECSQSNIKLKCAGFHSTERVNSSLFAPQGNVCLVNSGNSIAPGGSVSFRYAWDPPFFLWPASAVPKC